MPNIHTMTDQALIKESFTLAIKRQPSTERPSIVRATSVRLQFSTPRPVVAVLLPIAKCRKMISPAAPLLWT
jgi:hypothetical protein